MKLEIKKENIVQKRCGKIEKFYDFNKNKIEFLGKGKYGKVIQGINKLTKEKRAIKIIKKTKNENKNLHEFKILAKLDHPNIINVFEYFEDSKFIYFVWEKLNGGNLLESLKLLKFIKENEVKEIMKKIFQTINYIHNNNIIHHDLKLENIMFSDKNLNNIKIIDFGISKVIKNRNYINNKNLYGSLLYVSPELININYNKSIDIWAIGVIMYMLLSGSPPFYEEDPNELANKILSFDFNFNNIIWDKISSEAKDLITNILCCYQNRSNISEILNHPWLKDNSINNNNLNIDPFIKYYNNNNNNIIKNIFLNDISYKINITNLELESNFNNLYLFSKDNILNYLFYGYKIFEDVIINKKLYYKEFKTIFLELKNLEKVDIYISEMYFKNFSQKKNQISSKKIIKYIQNGLGGQILNKSINNNLKIIWKTLSKLNYEEFKNYLLN